MDKKIPPSIVSRRKFIALSLGTVASLSLPAILASCAPTATPTPTKAPGATTPPPPPSPTPAPPTITSTIAPSRTPTPLGPASSGDIIQPKVIWYNKNTGLLDSALVIKNKQYTLPQSQATPIPTPQGPKTMRVYGSPKVGVTMPNPDNDDDWDWAFPGPTFRIKPGGKVKIKLYNRLPIQENPGKCNPITIPATATTAPAGTATPTAFPTDTYPECFHADNVTNMHFHGFHVDQGERSKDPHFSPSETSYGDDVYLALYPYGQPPHDVHAQKGIHNEIGEVDFEFDVPLTQAPGTHWYHPHNHGSTDLQVTNGLSGAFIVDDSLDDLFPPNAKPEEYVLVIQDIAPTVNFAIPGSNKPITLINGQIKPNIPMKAGEVQRWRLINATGKGSNLYSMNFSGTTGEKPEIYLISSDGVFIDNDTWDNESPVNGIYLAPGNRVDFLVKAVKEGKFSLQADSLQTEKGPGGGGGQAQPTATPSDIPKTVVILSTTVSGTQTPEMELPEKLPERIFNQRPILDSEIVNKEPIKVEFTVVGGKVGGQAPVFQIDGKSFDPCDIDHTMLLDTAEEWTITNSTTLAHPFHIHLNPFFIKEFYDPRGGLPDPGRRWQDVIIIPAALQDAKGNVVLNPDGSAKDPGRVIIRHRFPDIADKFVIHCHILGHEDRGMMRPVQVIDPTKPIIPC